MKRLGPVQRLWPALALVLVTNAVVLSGIAYNRAGSPEAEIALTERELPIGYADPENTGRSLRLDWVGPRWGYGDPDWFDQARLEALGFDCRFPLTDEAASWRYGKALPLERYVVLELEGDAWRRWLAAEERQLEEARRKAARDPEMAATLQYREKEYARARVAATRLFLVDVGRDAADLRQRYPDRTRYLVAPAEVRLAFHPAAKEEDGTTRAPFLRGFVSEVLVEGIHVPRRWRGPLDAIRKKEQGAGTQEGYVPGGSSSYGGPPRYGVTLRYGRRFEPWIADLRPLPGP